MVDRRTLRDRESIRRRRGLKSKVGGGVDATCQTSCHDAITCVRLSNTLFVAILTYPLVVSPVMLVRQELDSSVPTAMLGPQVMDSQEQTIPMLLEFGHRYCPHLLRVPRLDAPTTRRFPSSLCSRSCDSRPVDPATWSVLLTVAQRTTAGCQDLATSLAAHRSGRLWGSHYKEHSARARFCPPLGRPPRTELSGHAPLQRLRGSERKAALLAGPLHILACQGAGHAPAQVVTIEPQRLQAEEVAQLQRYLTA